MLARASEPWTLCRKQTLGHKRSKHSAQLKGVTYFCVLMNIPKTQKKKRENLYNQDHYGFGGWRRGEGRGCMMLKSCPILL